MNSELGDLACGVGYESAIMVVWFVTCVMEEREAYLYRGGSVQSVGCCPSVVICSVFSLCGFRTEAWVCSPNHRS